MAGVYISYPFCAQKCTYCNFASGVYSKETQERYLDTLEREIRAVEWPWTPETLYVGGGTPASMDRILDLIPGRPWREATMEAAPGQLPAAFPLGINRVSLGVQSFVERELRRTGRRHNAAVVERDVAALRSMGIDEINIDLIAGLPGQTKESLCESLDWIERLAVPHVSVYMLEIDGDSRLGQEILAGGSRYGAAEAPSEDETAEFYEIAVERLRHCGLARYEISNFARPGHESLHNLKYWRLEPYLGFGADAHSFDGRLRWQNVETVEEYIARPNPRLDSTPACEREERFFIGLRLSEGVAPSAEEWEHWRKPLDEFLSMGLLERAGERVRLTPRGVLVSNEVFAEFIHD